MSENVSRRIFLRGSAVAAAASVIGFKGLFEVNAAQTADDDAGTILNLAATAETLACVHYYNSLSQGLLQFTPAQTAYIKAALAEELAHLELLNASGGKSLVDKFFTPQNVFRDLSVFFAYSELAENAFIGAYLAATRRFAQLNQSLLAATTAQIAVVEGQHLALIREAAGKLPNNVTLPQATYFKVSDVVPTLTSFLQGANEFDKTPLPYPGADAIRKLIGNIDVIAIRPFLDLTQFQNPQISATMSSTKSSTKSASTVSPAPTNVSSTASATSAPTNAATVSPTAPATSSATASATAPGTVAPTVSATAPATSSATASATSAATVSTKLPSTLPATAVP